MGNTDGSGSAEATTEESGGALRQRLEATLAEKAAAEAKAAQALAELTVVKSGFKFVKTEDLVGIAHEEMAAKAAELEQTRAQERETVLREALVERGVADGDLDAALKALAGQATADPPAVNAATRAAQLGNLTGPPVTGRPSQEALYGPDRITAALRAETR
jgi:hypothetical protein